MNIRLNIACLRSHCCAFGNVSGGAPSVPRETKMQRWLRDAGTDDTKADLIEYAIRADNWYDLYKCMELARRLVGGKKALETRLGAEWVKWDDTFYAANLKRHAPNPAKPPRPYDPPFEEAREYVLKTVGGSANVNRLRLRGGHEGASPGPPRFRYCGHLPLAGRSACWQACLQPALLVFLLHRLPVSRTRKATRLLLKRSARQPV